MKNILPTMADIIARLNLLKVLSALPINVSKEGSFMVINFYKSNIKNVSIINTYSFITASNEIITASNEVITTSNEFITTSNEVITASNEVITASNEVITTSNDVVTTPCDVVTEV